MVDEEPAGRLWVDRSGEVTHVLDITLLPAYRRLGLGTALLRELIDEAEAAGRVLSVHVEQFNPARTLYERLGFVAVTTHGVHVLMERRPTR